MELLHSFREQGRIDADLFDLLLSSGVYRRYADAYLSPEQRDEVDIDRFLKRT